MLRTGCAFVCLANLSTTDGRAVQHVDPWTVVGKVDYDKLITKFGSSRLTEDFVARHGSHCEPSKFDDASSHC